MTKTEMLSRLKKIHQGECRTRGLFTLIQMLIHYFTDPSIPEYEFNGIFHSLPKHVVRAVDILRTSKDPKIEAFRKSYSEEMERDEKVPSLTDVTFSGLARTELCITLSRDLSKLLLGQDCGVWIEKDLYAYFTAQDSVVRQMIHRFDAEVYQDGLFEVIQKCPASGMSGTFGQTSLRSIVTIGRVMFTLARRIDGGETVYRDHEDKEIEQLCRETRVNFVGGKKSDKHEAYFGIQSMNADLVTTVGMFGDVFANWPKDKEGQKRVYHADEGVSMM